jgi:hypothetical protein
MEFTLFKHGQIKSKESPKGKHDLRIEFHYQLKKLWGLSSWDHDKNENWQKDPWKTNDLNLWKTNNKLYKEKLKKNFICLVTKDLDMYVELKVNFYVPKGTPFRDIDNKLKTICDALKLPDKDKQGNIPEYIKYWEQMDEENPLVCLLEDDELIYNINADTDYLLGSQKEFLKRKEMLCIINVKIKGNRYQGAYNDLIV